MYTLHIEESLKKSQNGKITYTGTVILYYQISRAKFEPEKGFEPGIFGSLARRSLGTNYNLI